MHVYQRYSRAFWVGLLLLPLTGCIFGSGSSSSPAAAATASPLTAQALTIKTPSGTPGTSQISVSDPNAAQSHYFAITAAPTHGSATVDPNGMVTYTPALGFTGNDSLVVSVNNSNSPPQSGSVTINVKVLNQAPAPTAPALITTINTSKTIQINANDPDEGQSHTYAIGLGAKYGKATVDGTGIVTYKPRLGVTGTDKFEVVVTDDGTPLALGRVTVNVTIVNRVPIVKNAPSITTASNAPGTSQIIASDPDSGQSLSFTVTTPPGNGTAIVTAAGLVTYSPRPGSSGADSLTVTVADNGTPQQSVAVTIPVTVLPIALSMTANPDPVVLKGLVTYQLQVSNVGDADSMSVSLQDTVPDINGSKLAVLITGGGVCSTSPCAAGSVITWPDETLALGQTASVSFSVKQDTTDTTLVPDGTLIHNSATATYADGSETATSDVVVSDAAGLSMGMAATQDPVKPGDQVTYTITIGNTAALALPQSAAGILRATLPVGMTFVSANNGGAVGDGYVQWSLGSVPAGGSKTYTYTVTVDNTLANGTLLQLLTQVLDGQTALAQATASTQVQAAWPLMLSVTADTNPVPLMGSVKYTLHVTNVGTDTLYGVALQDMLPDLRGYFQISMISNGGTCSNGCGAGDLLTWPSFDLAAGDAPHDESFVLTVNTLDPTQVPFGTLIHNTAAVTATVTTTEWSGSQSGDLVVKD